MLSITEQIMKVNFGVLFVELVQKMINNFLGIVYMCNSNSFQAIKHLASEEHRKITKEFLNKYIFVYKPIPDNLLHYKDIELYVIDATKRSQVLNLISLMKKQYIQKCHNEAEERVYKTHEQENIKKEIEETDEGKAYLEALKSNKSFQQYLDNEEKKKIEPSETEHIDYSNRLRLSFTTMNPMEVFPNGCKIKTVHNNNNNNIYPTIIILFFLLYIYKSNFIFL